mmetsp:Transcript_13642/g.25080  ORF Transcript_13642/g.25080 Transcript_13642/m.25080 type:complete len:218 (-) Transcript_13642:91-744(-)
MQRYGKSSDNVRSNRASIVRHRAIMTYSYRDLMKNLIPNFSHLYSITDLTTSFSKTPASKAVCSPTLSAAFMSFSRNKDPFPAIPLMGTNLAVTGLPYSLFLRICSSCLTCSLSFFFISSAAFSATASASLAVWPLVRKDDPFSNVFLRSVCRSSSSSLAGGSMRLKRKDTIVKQQHRYLNKHLPREETKPFRTQICAFFTASYIFVPGPTVFFQNC